MAKKVESGGAQPEAAGKGKAQVSKGRRDKRTSQKGSPDLQALEARLGERIAEEVSSAVERRFQSAKDKRWAELERRYGALSEMAAEKKGGGKESGALDGKLLDKAKGILEAAGLANDPEAFALLQERGYNEDVEGYLEMLGDITALALGREKRSPASGASVAQPSGGQAPEPDLRAEYELRVERIRPGDVSALMELKREFRQKGLDVY